MPVPPVNTTKLIRLSKMPTWLEMVINTDGSIMLRTDGSLREISVKATGQAQFIQFGPVPGIIDQMERVPLTD